jgi:hypothetical protein
MLAYLYGRLGDRQNEYRRLGEYFEKYGAVGMGYTFLPLATRNGVLRYLREWQLRYPWVLKIGLISPGGPAQAKPSSNPPENILLGVEMAADVYYKLTDGENVLKGGQFRRGFNSIPLRAKKLFRGLSIPYTLNSRPEILWSAAAVVQMERQGAGEPAEAAAGASLSGDVLRPGFWLEPQDRSLAKKMAIEVRRRPENMIPSAQATRTTRSSSGVPIMASAAIMGPSRR